MTTAFRAAPGRGEAETLGAQAGARPAAAAVPVLFVVMQSGASANGGVESITQVLEQLRRVRPLVVTQSETAATRRWREAGCEVLVWPTPGRPSAASVLRFNYGVYRLLRSRGRPVLHCNDITSLWHAGFGARAAGSPIVFNIRSVKPPGQEYGWRWRMAGRLSDRRLALSAEMRDALARRLPLPSRAGGQAEVEFIYSVVDPARLSPMPAGERALARRRMGIGPSCFAVGVVAAFHPRKRQLELIREAAPLLKAKVPHARLYFVGDFDPERDDYARRCAEAVRERGLEGSVTFVGYSEKVADWYGVLDAVAVASKNEGLARCMIEAVACATPVVSFDVCSAREILEGHGCGFVVPQGGYGALVEKLALLAGDKAARRELGERGARAARELFDPRRVAGLYEELYSSLYGR